MASPTLRAGLRHRLLQQLAAKCSQAQSPLSQGFTLIELLVVVIIVGILASVALPGFLSQSDKAKASSAKALASAAAKECQVFLVEATGATFARTTTSTNEIAVTGDTCTAAAGGAFVATVASPSMSFTATVGTNGGITKTCTGTIGCTNSTW